MDVPPDTTVGQHGVVMVKNNVGIPRDQPLELPPHEPRLQNSKSARKSFVAGWSEAAWEAGQITLLCDNGKSKLFTIETEHVWHELAHHRVWDVMPIRVPSLLRRISNCSLLGPRARG